mmetsp:Transcript_12154/g.27257  ORF Transcript_12154/g.27257 Transcript_12154/m.27257 type:complete len:210 (+) Transcript_12154:126-755(+)
MQNKHAKMFNYPQLPAPPPPPHHHLSSSSAPSLKCGFLLRLRPAPDLATSAPTLEEGEGAGAGVGAEEEEEEEEVEECSPPRSKAACSLLTNSSFSPASRRPLSLRKPLSSLMLYLNSGSTTLSTSGELALGGFSGFVHSPSTLLSSSTPPSAPSRATIISPNSSADRLHSFIRVSLASTVTLPAACRAARAPFTNFLSSPTGPGPNFT